VVERTRELGIRMALGAATSKILREVVGSGMVLAVCGVVAGAIVARMASRLMTSMVWGITPSDPLTFAGVILLLLVVAVMASSIPALKVLRLDPARVLRQD
jgi:ABC-type antimicrobial peptide transport system permease subunit